MYTSFILIRLFYHRKAKASRSKVEFHESKLNMVVRTFLGLGYIGLLVVYVFYPPLLAWAGFLLPEWFRWIGGLITLVSVALIWWVQWALGVQFDTTLHIQDGHQLISRGPYRWVRHPMYTALFILGIGWLLLTANWFVGGPLMVGILFVVITRVRDEEALLLEVFGDTYQAYMEKTGRFLPRFVR
jgi:protein-S-isoprenylcysteine O-methyltransferase Ste14